MPTDDTWRPWGTRDDPDAAKAYDALVEGVPPYMRKPLVTWMTRQFELSPGSDWLNIDLAARMELSLRRALPYNKRTDPDTLAEAIVKGDEAFCLQAIDLLLREQGRAAEDVGDILKAGSSAYRVGSVGRGHLGLLRRVDPAVEALAQEAIRRDASGQLREAWGEAFGLDANPSAAVDRVNKAVEAAIGPIVSPKNERATTGTIISDIEQAPPGRFSLRLQPNRGLDPLGVFADTLRLFWQSQRRHADNKLPADLTPEQAQDLVVLGTTIVDMAQRGAFRRVDRDA